MNDGRHFGFAQNPHAPRRRIAPSTVALWIVVALAVGVLVWVVPGGPA